MASNGKRMVKEDLIKYLEEVQTNNPDPSDIGGGTDFTPTNGLEFTEVEGETYLGLTQVTVQQINGELRQTRKGAVNFYVTDTTRPALSFQNQDNIVEFKNGSSEGGYFGRRRDTALDEAKFYFLNYWNGGRNRIFIPNTHTTEADKTIALGIKGSYGNTIYAGNDGLIDFTTDSITANELIIDDGDKTTLGNGYITTSNNYFEIHTNENTSNPFGTFMIDSDVDASDNDISCFSFQFGNGKTVYIRYDGIYYENTKVVSFPTQS